MEKKIFFNENCLVIHDTLTRQCKNLFKFFQLIFPRLSEHITMNSPYYAFPFGSSHYRIKWIKKLSIYSKRVSWRKWRRGNSTRHFYSICDATQIQLPTSHLLQLRTRHFKIFFWWSHKFISPQHVMENFPQIS